MNQYGGSSDSFASIGDDDVDGLIATVDSFLQRLRSQEANSDEGTTTANKSQLDNAISYRAVEDVAKTYDHETNDQISLSLTHLLFEDTRHTQQQGINGWYCNLADSTDCSQQSIQPKRDLQQHHFTNNPDGNYQNGIKSVAKKGKFGSCKFDTPNIQLQGPLPSIPPQRTGMIAPIPIPVSGTNLMYRALHVNLPSSAQFVGKTEVNTREADVPECFTLSPKRMYDFAQFPFTLYLLLDEATSRGFDSIVSWQSHGRAFRVKDKNAFLKHVMPQYFQQTRFTSFQRQLSLYGFVRITLKGSDYGAYFHQHFMRGFPQLCSNIRRNSAKVNSDHTRQLSPTTIQGHDAVTPGPIASKQPGIENNSRVEIEVLQF